MTKNTSKVVDVDFKHSPAFLSDDDYIVFPKSQKVSPEPFKGMTLEELQVELASGFLKEASDAMDARAALRDSPTGERTAEKIAKVFNAVTGHDLTEDDAWLFLLIMKIVRSRNGKYNRDDFVDMAAYAGLAGECASKKG